jgi:hypothetical protein
MIDTNPRYVDHLWDKAHWHVFSAHVEYIDSRKEWRVRHRWRGWLLRDVIGALARWCVM